MKTTRRQNRFAIANTLGVHELARTTILVLSAVLIVGCASCSDAKSHNKTAKSKSSTDSPQLMFVQVAENLKVDPAAKTIRLVKVDQQTLYFSDRPVRMAGHLKMADFLNEWTAKAGKDNFSADPPNATLSVYEPGKPDNTVVVVEVTNPIVEGADIIYGYKIIEGTMPTASGATSLFIDWIGVGGGVGRGFHGVGVGRRGPGWRGW
ncbi:MAG: hypothetical protein HY287_06540 [Planctomycetes bacterium]|nr:hypothetical protein [Planctomycetota bacterium]